MHYGWSRVLLQELVRPAGKDIPLLLRNPEVHYRVQNTSPLAPILSKMHPAQTLTPNFFRIHFNINNPSRKLLTMAFHLHRMRQEDVHEW
jgi:hypothetical protein